MHARPIATHLPRTLANTSSCEPHDRRQDRREGDIRVQHDKTGNSLRRSRSQGNEANNNYPWSLTAERVTYYRISSKGDATNNNPASNCQQRDDYQGEAQRSESLCPKDGYRSSEMGSKPYPRVNSDEFMSSTGTVPGPHKDREPPQPCRLGNKHYSQIQERRNGHGERSQDEYHAKSAKQSYRGSNR